MFKTPKLFPAEGKACIWMLMTVKRVASPRRWNKTDPISGTVLLGSSPEHIGEDQALKEGTSVLKFISLVREP